MVGIPGWADLASNPPPTVNAPTLGDIIIHTMAIKKDDEVIKLYGEFLINFELICSNFRFSTLLLLYPTYDQTKINMVEIMAEGLTADQLKKKYLALLIEKFSTASQVYKLAKRLTNHFDKLIPLRNSLAHGTSFVGQADLIEGSKKGVLTLRHPKLTKDGLSLNFKHFNIATLKEVIKLLKDMRSSLTTLSILIKHDDQREDIKQKFIQIATKKIEEIDSKLLHLKL